jgi:DNA repair exonuclease SbcCD ATPase subunit
MAKTIKGNDIIEDGHLNDAISQAKELLSVYKELDKVILKTAQDSKKAGQQADTGKAEGIKQLNAELQKSNELKKAKLQIDSQIVKGEAKLAALETKQAQALAKTKLEIQRKNKANKEQAILTSKTSTEYEKQSVRLNQMRRRLKDLTLTEGESSKATRKLRAQVQALDGRLKKADASAGQFQRSVGNYGKALGRVGGMLKGFGATLLATFSIRAVGSFFKASIDGFRVQEKAVAKVEQAINSTGGAAGRTSEELQKMASSLQENSLFGDEQILNDVTAQLLTFTNIGGEQFDRTQQVAMDLATVLDGDLKSASIQLGKALNDPVKNLSALSRSGIQFSAEQKELINTLAESGRMADAQNVILSELERQYGGQAKAAAEADGGIQQLKNTFGDMQEIIGGELIKVIKPLANDLKEFIQNIDPEDLKGFANAIGSVVQGLVEWGKEIFGVIAALGNAGNSTADFQTALVKLSKMANPLRFIMKPITWLLDQFGVLVDVQRQLRRELEWLGLGKLADDLDLAAEATKKLTEEQKRNNSVREKSVEVTNEILKAQEDEIGDISILIDALQNENTTREDKQKIINKLQADYPDVIKNIDLETASTEQLVQVKKELMKTLFNQAIAEKKALVTAELRGQILELELKKIGKTDEQIGRIQKKQDELVLGFKRIDEVEKELTKNLSEFVDNMNLESPIDDTGAAITRLKNEIQELKNELATVNEETDKARFDDITSRINKKIAELATFDAEYSALLQDGFDEEKGINEESVKEFKKTQEKKLKILKEADFDPFKDDKTLEFDANKDFESTRKSLENNLKQLEVELRKQGLDEEEIQKRLTDERLRNLEILKNESVNLFEEGNEKRLNAELEYLKELERINKTQEDEEEKKRKEKEAKEKEAREKAIKDLEKFRDETLDIFRQITEGRLNELDKQIEARNEAVSESKDEIKRLQKIADSGQGQAAIDAAKAVKAEQARIAKEKLEVEKLEKKKRNLLIITTGLEKAAQNINFGDPNPFKNAVGGIKSFLSELPQFSGGTVGTVADALGATGTTDGHVVRVDDNEHILSVKDSEKLHRAGLRTNEQIVNSAINGNNKFAVRKSMRGTASPDSKIIQRLDKVEAAIKNQKPVKIVQQHIDLNSGKEVLIDEKGNKNNIYHKPKPIVI